MRAIVVGGGIGGLSVAVALRCAGVEAAVFEAAAGSVFEADGPRRRIHGVRAPR